MSGCKKTLWVLALCSSLGASPLLADQRIAFSDSRGVDVVATGEAWCSEKLNLEIRLRDDSLLRGDQAALLGLANQLSGPIGAECEKATSYEAHIVEEGGAKAAYIVLAEREQGWVARAVDASEPPNAADLPPPLVSDVKDDETGHDANDGQNDQQEVSIASLEPIRLVGNPALHDFAVAHIRKEDLDESKVVDLTSYIYDCKAYGNVNNEFDRKRLRDHWLPELRKIQEGKSERLGAQYIFPLMLKYDQYDFSSEVLPIAPFGAQKLALRYSRSCYGAYIFPRHGQPELQINLGEHAILSALPISPKTAEQLIKKTGYPRNVLVDIEFSPIGKAKKVGKGRLDVPVLDVTLSRLTFWDRKREMLIYELSALEIEELQRVAAAEYQFRNFSAQVSEKAQEINARLREFVRQPDRFYRLARVFDSSNNRPVHPVPASAGRNTDASFGVLLQAGAPESDYTAARWPSRVVLDASPTKTTFERDKWYFVQGRPELLTNGPRGTALLRASFAYPCAKDACAEFDELDWLYEKWVSEFAAPPHFEDERMKERFVRILASRVGDDRDTQKTPDTDAGFQVPDVQRISSDILQSVYGKIAGKTPR
ncbi:hypothetical protein [Tepidicaulis sp.]|uniref:hypothetical protein n=1 Tax=Tepidicaulis sp. TaxID=1920809 RepID=UPI003B5A3921